MCSILHRGGFKHLNLQRWELQMVYLQSLQQSEVLKGSPLNDADLIVLQMTVVSDTEMKRNMLLNIITENENKQLRS